ncbi:MAG: hypothetical protein ACYC91_08895 [Solirubrobacteraceae bacterium]
MNFSTTRRLVHDGSWNVPAAEENLTVERARAGWVAWRPAMLPATRTSCEDLAQARALVLRARHDLLEATAVDELAHDHARTAELEHHAAGRDEPQRGQAARSQIVAARAYVLVLATLGQLGATNNWSRSPGRVLYDEEPVTELGRQEADWRRGAG